MRFDNDPKTLALLAALSLAYPMAAHALPGDNNAAGTSADPVDGNGIRNSASSQDQARKLRQELAVLRHRYLYRDGARLHRLRAVERAKLELNLRAQELGALQYDNR